MKLKLLLLTFLFTTIFYAQENDHVNLDSTQITLIGNKIYKAYQAYHRSNDGSFKNYSIKYIEIDLSDVLFKTSQSVLLPGSYNALNALVILMKDNPKIMVQIDGHTDKVGHSSSNLKLSIRRARAIRLYLFRKGIKLERITAKGFGDQVPICDSPCKENQRVEFTIISDGNEKRLVSRKSEKIQPKN